MEHTCVNQKMGQAPRRRTLRGDKRSPEPGTHIIEFPGGAVEVTRLADGSYWAHIIVNRKQRIDGLEGRESAFGRVVDSRIDWADRACKRIPGLPEEAQLTQLAVRIVPELSE